MRVAIASVVAALVFGTGIAHSQIYDAVLTGEQETPEPVVTPATGAGSFNLDAEKMLHYEITFSGLQGMETGAHIHCCAPAGTGAGVLFTLPSGSPKIGSFGPLTAEQEADLNAGLMYVNVHSSLHGAGEIRGQILTAVSISEKPWGNVKKLFR